VRIVFKQLPLAMHFWAQVAAEAAMAAGAQGKFAEMDHLIFSKQGEIPRLMQAKAEAMGKSAVESRSEEIQREVFIDLAAGLGLETQRVRSEMEGGAHKDRVKREAAEAAALGVNGTPASFVNGRYLSGALPFEAFKAEVEKELSWARDGNRPAFARGTNVSQLRASQAAARPAGPDPAKVYDLKAGGAPFHGPAEAKVTILHYLDYQ